MRKITTFWAQNKSIEEFLQTYVYALTERNASDTESETIEILLSFLCLNVFGQVASENTCISFGVINSMNVLLPFVIF